MSGYVATDSTTGEKPPNTYGENDEVYAKDHGEGRTKLRVDQVLGDGTYKVRKDERAKEGGESVGQRLQ